MMFSHVYWFIINSKSGSSLGNDDTSFSVGIKLNVKMLPYATIWILSLQMNSTFTDSIIPIHALTTIRLFAKQIMQ